MIINVTACVAVPAELVAVTVKLNVPETVGVPESAPPVARLSPAGNVPVVTVNAGAGLPEAVKVWV